MKLYQHILSGLLAFSMIGSQTAFTAFADEQVIPADLDENLCELLLSGNQWELDTNSDGIISVEEVENCKQLYLNMDKFTDISWLEKFQNLRYVCFCNGTIGDFSVLTKLPNLRNIDFEAVPISDISFIKELNLETCRFSEMKEFVPLEQRLELITQLDYDIEAGYSERVGITPIGLLDDYSLEMSIDDTGIASFPWGSYGAWNEVYGVNTGSTAYHIYADGEEILSGAINVYDMDYVSPALLENPAQQIKILRSGYYSSTNSVLLDGTLYGIKGGTVTAELEHVKDYDYVSLKNEEGKYKDGDIVILEDGTLLINGKTVSSSKNFVQAENGCVIDKNNKIYAVYPKGEEFMLKQLSGDFKSFPYETKHYYVTQKGQLMYYKLEYVSGTLKLTSQDTGIKNPISGYDDMFVDEKHVFWVCQTYPSFTAKKYAENAVEAGRYYISKGGGTVYGYLGEDGKVHQAITGNVYDFIEIDDPQELPFVKAGGFYMHDYTQREENPLSENDAGVDYFLGYDGVMTISFCGKHYAISDALDAVCAEYDPEQQKGYIYFLRADGSLWQYCFEEESCQQIVSEFTQQEYLQGDANGDGIFNTQDIFQLQKWLKHNRISLKNWKACDLNNDQQLNIYDWVLMKRLLLNS